MPEQIRENTQPLNREAKRLLREAGEVPDPTLLYVVQLMQWALRNGKDSLPLGLRGAMSAAVENLAGAPPANAMKFLAESPNEPGLLILDSDDLKGRSPSQAAWNLLETFHAQLGMRLNQYSNKPFPLQQQD